MSEPHIPAPHVAALQRTVKRHEQVLKSLQGNPGLEETRREYAAELLALRHVITLLHADPPTRR